MGPRQVLSRPKICAVMMLVHSLFTWYVYSIDASVYLLFLHFPADFAWQVSCLYLFQGAASLLIEGASVGVGGVLGIIYWNSCTVITSSIAGQKIFLLQDGPSKLKDQTFNQYLLMVYCTISTGLRDTCRHVLLALAVVASLTLKGGQVKPTPTRLFILKFAHNRLGNVQFFAGRKTPSPKADLWRDRSIFREN